MVNMAAHADDAGVRRASSHRFTVRVPTVDTSVRAWWAAQDDPSASVRALIRDEVTKHGFTDTVNRPVTQLPRRGRPPLSDTQASEYQEAPVASSLPSETLSTRSTPAIPAVVPTPAVHQSDQIGMSEIFEH